MTAEAGITIRPVREADLPRLAEIELAAFPDAWSVDLLAGELEHPQALFLAAGRAGEPAAGYVSFRHGGGEAEILRLAVDPAERRRGVARALVEAGFARLRRTGVETCHLEVRATNPEAAAFYEALGFAVAGRRKRYYQDGTDALVMSKTL